MKVFICHPRTEAAVAQRLMEGLAQHGIESWLEAFELLPGDQLLLELERGLKETDAGVVLLGHSDTVEQGLYRLLIETLIWQKIEHNRRLIPVYLDPQAPIPPIPLVRIGSMGGD